MAVVDAFQHWVYETLRPRRRCKNCDAAWSDLWDRFIPFVDFTGLEDAKTLGWHRKRHIHRSRSITSIQHRPTRRNPGLGQRPQDQPAVAAYRSALSLGGTAPPPELYRTAGAKFAFDVETVGAAVALTERSSSLNSSPF